MNKRPAPKQIEAPDHVPPAPPSVTHPFEVVQARMIEPTLAAIEEESYPVNPNAPVQVKDTDRFQIKIVHGLPIIRDRETKMIYRITMPHEVYALVHLINNNFVERPKKKRKRRHRSQLLKEAGIEPQTGDPSL